MQNGIDISNHQGKMDLAAVLKQTATDFVICKATEGTGFVDKYCDKFMVIAQNKGYFNKGIPVLDWESAGKSNVKWAKEWLDRVYSVTGVKPVIYMSESVVNAYNWKAVAEAGYGLWVARYRDYNIDRNYDMSTCGKKPVVKWWSFYMMWQWTSVGRLNGYSGNLDCNAFYGDRAAWDAYVRTAEITTGGVQVEQIYAYTTLAAELPILRLGAKGNAVKLVQLIVGADPDGIWGPKTDAAVKAWEKKYRLEEDGLFDKPDWQVALDWLATT